MEYTLKLAHLYPERLNLYGDFGNVLALKRLAKFYGIQLEYTPFLLGEEQNLDDYDLYFMGGGQDHDQGKLMEDFLKKKGPILIKNFQKGKVFLGICGAFQLLGAYFLTKEENKIEGLNYFPMHTEGKEKRLIGNVVSLLSEEILKEFPPHKKSDALLFGFENHSGQSYLKEGVQALAKVLVGQGNNEEEGVEGAFLGNVFGTYLHGSFLPKNPFFTKYLLHLALKQKYKVSFFKEKAMKENDFIQKEKVFFQKEEKLRKDLALLFLPEKLRMEYFSNLEEE